MKVTFAAVSSEDEISDFAEDSVKKKITKLKVGMVLNPQSEIKRASCAFSAQADEYCAEHFKD